MRTTQWNRLEEVFLGAAALPESARAAYLDDHCGTDPELHREAEALLACDPAAHGDLVALIDGTARSLVLADMNGVRLGPWRIERELGRGGMGAVYLACRDGEDFEKQVAIKLIRPGVNPGSILPRFLAERRILAGLDHPFIARLIDAGTSPDGQPYFVMEYVEGASIRDYCTERHLGTGPRCELFRKVCEAVSYAHGRLVVHRDLKPANILVTPAGDPKLLDFGIATLIRAEEGPECRAVHALTSALTPQYASPEQARGEPVIASSDVYSLGIVLRELLEGLAVPEDVAAILEKATRHDPTARYSSAEQLGEDIRRYLEGRPVSARPAVWRYTARLFIARNRASVAAAAFSVLLLLGGVVSVAWEARQARRERRIAEERLGQMVELANRALFDVHGAIERLPGATDARRRIVQSTVEYLDRLNGQSGGDPAVLTALASAYRQVAQIEGSPLKANLGDVKGAESNYAKADTILSGLLRREPANVDLLLHSAELNSDRGQLTALTSGVAAARVFDQRALSGFEAVLRARPADFVARKGLSTLRLRQLLQMLASAAPAVSEREALAQLTENQALAREHPDDVDCLLNLATSWTELGQLRLIQGDVHEDIADFKKAAEIREMAFRLRPNDGDVQRDLMLVYGHIGDATGSPFMVSTGNAEEAVVWYGKAAVLARRLAEADRSNLLAQADLGIILMRIGAAENAAGEHAQALRDLQSAAAILDPLATGARPNFTNFQDAALVHEYSARSQAALGGHETAIAEWRRSLDFCLAVTARAAGDPSCLKQEVVDYNGLAVEEAATGDETGALAAAGKSLALAAPFGKGNRLTEHAYPPRALAAFGRVYAIMAGRDPRHWSESADYYRRAVAGWHASGLHDAPYDGEIRGAEAGLREAELALAPAGR